MSNYSDFLKRKSQKNLPKFFAAFFLIFFVATVFFLLKSPALSVKKIIVTTDYDFSANQEIARALESVKRENIFLFKEEKLAEEIKAQDIKIGNVEVKKEWLDKITVKIKKREAVALIPFQDSFFLVDREGLIFSQEKENLVLPVLLLSLQNLTVGSRIEGKEKNVFLILNALSGQEKIQSVKVEGKESVLQLAENRVVLLFLDGETESKIKALQVILNRFKIEGKSFKKIDLRFEKPVVEF